MIEARRLQRTFGEGLIEEEVADLWEDWMRHARAWSYDILEREVRANLVYRQFTRVGAGKVRVLTRTMQKITELAGEAGTRLRNRLRSVQHRLIETGRASRSKGEAGKEKLKNSCEKLLSATRQVVRQAQRFSAEVADGGKRSADVFEQAALEGHKRYIDTMVARVQRPIVPPRAPSGSGTKGSGGFVRLRNGAPVLRVGSVC